MSTMLIDLLVKLQNIDLEIKVIQKELNFLSYKTDSDRKTMESVLKTHAQERTGLCQQIKDSGLLARVSRLQTRYQGIFLAPVVDSVCFGCRMTIPEGLMVQLFKGENLIYCENCGRILRKIDQNKLFIKPQETPPQPRRGRKPKKNPIF